jgi:hypothetical protein
MLRKAEHTTIENAAKINTRKKLVVFSANTFSSKVEDTIKTTNQQTIKNMVKVITAIDKSANLIFEFFFILIHHKL